MATEDNTNRPDKGDHATQPSEESALGLDVRQLLGLGRAAPEAKVKKTETPPAKITPAVEPAMPQTGDVGEESTPAAEPVADIEAEPASIQERRSQPERRSPPEAPANPPSQPDFEDASDLVSSRERPPRPAFDTIETPLSGEEKKPAPAIAAPAPVPPEASLSETAKGAARPIPPVTAPSELSGLRPSIDPLAAGASLAPASATPAAPVPETPDLSAAANAKLEELASMSERTLEDYESFDDLEETAPQRSKRTPVIILASLLCVAVLAGGVVFAYRQGVKESTQTEVPVIVAETKATKEEPSNPGGVQIPHQNKLIYDRILGEETDIAEKIVPREEKVVNLSRTPALTTVVKSTPQANTVVEKVPSAPATSAVPVNPDAGNDPEPANAVETVSDELAKKLAAVTPPKPLTPPDSLINGNGIAPNLIVPGTAFVPDTTTAGVSRPLTETLNLPSSILGLETIVPGGDVVRQKTETETVAGVPQVPPVIQPAENPEAAIPAQDTPAASPDPAASAKLPPILPRRKPARSAAPTRVAAAVPATNAAATTGGFVIQIAAFRSQDEALSRYAALKRRHSGLLRPYTSFIQRADLGDRGIYYRLRLGPIGGKDKASNLCRSLLSAGEKDCLVRSR